MLATNAITAVKNTVAPIPTNLFASPSEQFSKTFLSAPEQRIKKIVLTLI
jgi:hypothetical protein